MMIYKQRMDHQTVFCERILLLEWGTKCTNKDLQRKLANITLITPKVLMAFDPSTSGIQSPYHMVSNSPKSVYFTLLFDGKIASVLYS